MKRIIFLFSILLTLTLFAEEPSAFKAGDLDSPNPYGLTSAEKKLVEQNKNIQSISRNLFDANQTQAELRNELDGIKSLLGNISEKQALFSDKMESDNNGSLKNISIRVDSLEKKLEENFKLQNENYDKIMATLTQMAKMIDEITQNYVSKDQLKLNMGKNYKDFKNKPVAGAAPSVPEEKNITNPESTATKPEINTTQTQVAKQEVKNVSDDELFAQAKALYEKNDLKASKEIFSKIKNTKSTKKANVYFYLGEIAYKNNEFKDALGNFQDSINIDEKSSFIPLMLYHSALSLEKLGNKGDAKKVLETLIQTYPKNYLIPSAKKKLKEL